MMNLHKKLWLKILVQNDQGHVNYLFRYNIVITQKIGVEKRFLYLKNNMC